VGQAAVRLSCEERAAAPSVADADHSHDAIRTTCVFFFWPTRLPLCHRELGYGRPAAIPGE
jgi:hypothetical protein